MLVSDDNLHLHTADSLMLHEELRDNWLTSYFIIHNLASVSSLQRLILTVNVAWFCEGALLSISTIYWIIKNKASRMMPRINLQNELFERIRVAVGRRLVAIRCYYTYDVHYFIDSWLSHACSQDKSRGSKGRSAVELLLPLNFCWTSACQIWFRPASTMVEGPPIFW